MNPIVIDPQSGFVTPRQLDIWRRAALGQTTKQIRDELGICRGTAEKHRYALYRTLGVNCIAQLTLKAVEHGVVPVTVRPLVVSRHWQRVRWVIPT